MSEQTSEVNLRELAKNVRENYLPAEKWSCRICGGPMTFAASDRDGTLYTCKTATKAKYSSENSEHWANSKRLNRIEPDAGVVQLSEAVLRLIDVVETAR